MNSNAQIDLSLRVERSVAHLAALAFVFCLCAAWGCRCCGYQIGSAGLYNENIKTVYVPMVQADTYREAFGERLTEAICKKITEQTPYALASPDKADSELSVRLTSETQSVSASNRYDDARQKNVNLVAVAVWRERRNGTVLAQTNPLPISSDDGVAVESQSYLVAETGQSTSTAQQEAIDKLASQIVGLMEIAW